MTDALLMPQFGPHQVFNRRLTVGDLMLKEPRSLHNVELHVVSDTTYWGMGSGLPVRCLDPRSYDHPYWAICLTRMKHNRARKQHTMTLLAQNKI